MKIEDDSKFKLLTGVTKKTFNELMEILQPEYDKAHKNGSNAGIGVGSRLVLALTYWREYRAMRQMTFDYELAVSTVCDNIHWVEDVLGNNNKFNFGTIKEEIEKLKKEGIDVKNIIVDVEEQPIERPIENQEKHYSGKKKRHTTKNQIIIDEGTTKIINIYNSIATTHDFQMIKDSNIIASLNELGISGKFDSGYQGIQKELEQASIPYKKSKYHKLTAEEKEFNKNLSSQRVKIEHTNRTIKIFRIMKETYRNHQRRYDTKLKIMCTIYNMNLN